MINVLKLKIYKSFDGDIDFFIRSASKKEKSLILEDEWRVIDRLISDITIINNGLAAQEFKEVFEDKLAKNFEDESAKIFLYQLARDI